MKKERTESPAVDEGAWAVPVLATTAHSGEGVDALLETVEKHRAWLLESGQLEARRKARARGRVEDVVNRELRRITWGRPETLRRRLVTRLCSPPDPHQRGDALFSGEGDRRRLASLNPVPPSNIFLNGTGTGSR